MEKQKAHLLLALVATSVRMLMVSILALLVSSIPQLLWLKEAVDNGATSAEGPQLLSRIVTWIIYAAGFIYVGYRYVHRLRFASPWVRLLAASALYAVLFLLVLCGMMLWTSLLIGMDQGQLTETFDAFALVTPTWRFLSGHLFAVLLLTGAGVWTAESRS